MLDTRDKIAARFREEHDSTDPQDPSKANVYPHFIGVFDTIAALGRTMATVGLAIGIAAAVTGVALFLSLSHLAERAPFIRWLLAYFTFGNIFWVFAAGLVGWAG
jgi:hypothetical protein